MRPASRPEFKLRTGLSMAGQAVRTFILDCEPASQALFYRSNADLIAENSPIVASGRVETVGQGASNSQRLTLELDRTVPTLRDG